MLNKKWSDRVPTACVSLNGINYQLDICPKFWDDLTPKHRIGLLKHELLHIGLFHITDFKHLTNHEIANIAMLCFLMGLGIAVFIGAVLVYLAICEFLETFYMEGGND